MVRLYVQKSGIVAVILVVILIYVYTWYNHDNQRQQFTAGALSDEIQLKLKTIYNEIPISGRNDKQMTNTNWEGIYSYVPNGIYQCNDLFKNNKSLPNEFSLNYNKFINKVNKFHIIEGYSASYIEEFLVYIRAVKAPFVKTVCETGFNAGHSTFTWLAANVHTHVYSFDLGTHTYGPPMAQYLTEKFPGRLNVTWGDSTKTLPEFHRHNPNIKCDLISIDGGHNNKVCQSDYDVFRRMASTENIVILDNYPDTRSDWMTSLGNVWEGGKKRGELAEVLSCKYRGKNQQGFSVGRFVNL